MKISQLILLIAIVGCLDAKSLINPPSQTNGTCRKLVDSMAEEKGLYCAGLVRDKVLIITKDDTVFEFPYSNIDEGGNKWNLQDLKGIPLKDKWPSLYNHPHYAAARQNTFQCFPFVEANRTYLVIETKIMDGAKGVVFDLDRAEVIQQSISWAGNDDVVLLSTNIPRTYYQVRRNGIDGAFQITTYKSISSSILDPGLRIRNTTKYSNVCKVGGSVYKLVMRPNDDKGCDKLQWSIMMGFVSDKKFYLFTGSSILLFSEELYTKKGSEQDAYVVGSGSLLECGGAVPINKKSKYALLRWPNV